jgi:hypothetical protein
MADVGAGRYLNTAAALPHLQHSAHVARMETWGKRNTWKDTILK